MPINGPTDAVAWLGAQIACALARTMAERGLLDDDEIKHLHDLLAVARKHIEASGDADFEHTILVLEQTLPLPSRRPEG